METKMRSTVVVAAGTYAILISKYNQQETECYPWISYISVGSTKQKIKNKKIKLEAKKEANIRNQIGIIFIHIYLWKGHLLT